MLRLLLLDVTGPSDCSCRLLMKKKKYKSFKNACNLKTRASVLLVAGFHPDSVAFLISLYVWIYPWMFFFLYLTFNPLNCTSVPTCTVQPTLVPVPGPVVGDGPDIYMQLAQCSEVTTRQTAINLNPPATTYLTTDKSISNWNLLEPPGELMPHNVSKQSEQTRPLPSHTSPQTRESPIAWLLLVREKLTLS